MKIITKPVRDLTKEEYRACYAANYGRYGYMREELVQARRKPLEYPAEAVLIWDDQRPGTSALKAWALLTKVRTDGSDVSATTYAKRKAKYSVQFWVKRQYRRQGLAANMMRTIKATYDPRPHVFPHDDASGEFFSGYDVTVLEVDRSWLRPAKPKVA